MYRIAELYYLAMRIWFDCPDLCVCLCKYVPMWWFCVYQTLWSVCVCVCAMCVCCLCLHVPVWVLTCNVHMNVCIIVVWFMCIACATGNYLPGIALQFAMHFFFFYMTAIQDIFCVALFLHISVQNLVWNICLYWLNKFAINQIWRGIIP